jgi:hypothetical protein
VAAFLAQRALAECGSILADICKGWPAFCQVLRGVRCWRLWFFLATSAASHPPEVCPLQREPVGR